MTRPLTRIALAIALLSASLAWVGFVALHTVLDPTRTGEVADALLDDPAVRGIIEDAVIERAWTIVPAGAPVEHAEIAAAAATAMDDPRTEAALRAALAGTHRAMLGDEGAVTTVDGGLVAAAAVDAFVARRPELAGAVPEVAPFEVALPGIGMPRLGPARDLVATLTPGLGAVAAVAAVAAFVAAHQRAVVVSRLGVWALVTGAGWTAAGLATAHLLATSDSAALGVAAVVAVLVGAILPSSLGLCVGGSAAVVGARVWHRARA